MKLKLLLLVFLASLALSGCATDPADKAFFEQGWVQPGERDMSLGH